MEFNMFDIVVVIISLLLGIKGFFKGIIKELAGLLGIIGGIFFAGQYYLSAGNYINEHLLTIPNQSAISLVGFVSVFMLVWAIVWIIGEMLAKIFKIAKLSIIDKLIGAIFSAGKFFLLIAVAISLLTQVQFLKDQLAKYEKNSVMYPIMLNIGNKIIKLNPKEVQKEINDVKEKVNKNVGKNIKENIDSVKKNIIQKVSKEINKEVNNSVKKENN